MSDSMSFDFSDLDKLAADLGEVPNNAGPFIRVAMHKSSEKIRDTWREKLDGSERLPHLGRAISWELSGKAGVDGSSVTSEIGPVMGKRQAAFAHLSEFGSVNNPGRGYGLRALEENQDDFEHGLSEAIKDAERKSGL